MPEEPKDQTSDAMSNDADAVNQPETKSMDGFFKPSDGGNKIEVKMHDEQDVSSDDVKDAAPESTDSEPAATEKESTPEPDVEPATGMPAYTETPAEEPAPVPTAMPVVSGKKSKKKWVVLGVIAAVLLLLVGGGVAAYAWYQAPQKVVEDGLASTLVTKNYKLSGDYSLESAGMTVSATMNVASTKASSTGSTTITLDIPTLGLKQSKITMKLDGTVTKSGDELYFKASNLAETANIVVDGIVQEQATAYGLSPKSPEIAQVKAQMMAYIDPIISKIDNQWVKITRTDMKNLDSTGTLTCLVDQSKKISNDDSYMKQIVDIYQKNRFIEVKDNLGVKNGKQGYRVDINKDQLAKFDKAMSSSKYAKAMDSCDKSGMSDSSDSSSVSDLDMSKVKMELWMDQWSHALADVKFNYEDTGENAVVAKMNLHMDTSAKVSEATAPADAKPISLIQSQIETLLPAFGLPTSEATSATSPSI